MKRTLRQLIEAGYIKAKPAAEPKPHGLTKTHCKRGHPMVDWNLYLWGGHRRCLACKKLAEADRTPDHRAEWGYMA